jgi:hypothetical protein
MKATCASFTGSVYRVVTAPYHEVVCNIVRAVKARRARRGEEMKKTREEIERIGASEHRLGFLVNWNVIVIKDGIKRMVNRL